MLLPLARRSQKGNLEGPPVTERVSAASGPGLNNSIQKLSVLSSVLSTPRAGFRNERRFVQLARVEPKKCTTERSVPPAWASYPQRSSLQVSSPAGLPQPRQDKRFLLLFSALGLVGRKRPVCVQRCHWSRSEHDEHLRAAEGPKSGTSHARRTSRPRSLDGMGWRGADSVSEPAAGAWRQNRYLCSGVSGGREICTSTASDRAQGLPQGGDHVGGIGSP